MWVLCFEANHFIRIICNASLFQEKEMVLTILKFMKDLPNFDLGGFLVVDLKAYQSFFSIGKHLMVLYCNILYPSIQDGYKKGVLF